ncbi:MAG: hypothetical protein LAO55_05465 [Acidobacteriia bacterium]|nr:hypothetical protein [Terriglobia bacterium]
MGRLWLAVLLVGSGLAQTPPDLQRAFETAERQILRLNPSAFPELPKKVLADLKRRGCLIPQVQPVNEPHNVIKGEFAKPGQTDWAVLCSIGGVSSILVYWNGSAANPAQIAEKKDFDNLQDSGADGITYSRAIAPADRAYILQHYQAYGGTKPPPLDHQGIDDAFVEKGSVVFYFYQGKWLQLTGAD